MSPLTDLDSNSVHRQSHAVEPHVRQATPGTDWSDLEVEATVAVYFQMLRSELRGESYNKAEWNRRLQAQIPGRSRTAIEFKHSNITAALNDRGRPGINGFKARGNYQDLLGRVVEAHLAAAPDLDDLLMTIVTKEISPPPPAPESLLELLVDAPVPNRGSGATYVRANPPIRQANLRNYLEVESKNRSLGRAGEELVLAFEHERLWRSGNRKLADAIDHVADKGLDHLGYDIESFETDGSPRLIEVKTTQFSATTPFFATANEVTVSERRAADYHVYRVHRFTHNPRIFQLSGALAQTCDLAPTVYRAQPVGNPRADHATR